ncbi:MAG: sigma-54 dependent transcriptional regulator [Desulfococcaceae bacterium]|jgi:two-component system response regulator AtoC|nr:sigma-54 dependent transcriptional regulator [Desulfococcaceae bacterium]
MIGKNMEKSLLIIDDEDNMRHMLASLLKKSGYLVEGAADGYQGLEKVRQQHYDFILCDLKMPNMGGMEFLKAAKSCLENSTVIVMSAYGSINTAIEAMKEGAYDYISKPFKSDEVHMALKKAEERESLRKENSVLKERIRNIEKNYSFANMIGKSRVMQDVFRLAQKAAFYNATVLISGESGTGKELIARGIHFQGDRAQFPFVAVNCGGIPENLLESEFFGYKKGAFTGAVTNRKGLFEEAQGGTIFLDEIGELPLTLQVKFLRVLQENEVRPIGEAKSRKLDVRVLAATAKNLEEEVEKGAFRQDLFYRLNVLPIRLPSLQERSEDIPLLVNRFIERFNQTSERKIQGISQEGMSLLLQHEWPGNVRELENAIERAAILAEQDILLPENFPIYGKKTVKKNLMEDDFDGYSLKEAQKILEKELIIKALTATEGNRTKAIQLLEISHPSLLSKMKAYNILM